MYSDSGASLLVSENKSHMLQRFVFLWIITRATYSNIPTCSAIVSLLVRAHRACLHIKVIGQIRPHVCHNLCFGVINTEKDCRFRGKTVAYLQNAVNLKLFSYWKTQQLKGESPI